MWLVEGAFDQEAGTNLEQKKLKLLKPGRSYPLGRKRKHPLQLVLSHPKISGEHISFVVGENSVDSVSDPTIRPTLKIQNHKNKALQVSRDVNGAVTRHLIQPMSEDEVLGGDCIALVTGIYVNIYWRPICCFSPPKTLIISFESCASLGVKVVSTPRPEITHHLTPTLSVSTSLVTSLLTLAHVVRPDWLTELLHLGATAASAGGPSALESEFRLPALAQYFPARGPALPAPLKSTMLWEPNEQRVGMLKGWRLLFVGEKGREMDAETRALVERGGGEYEVFDVSGGLTRWRQTLSRNKRKAEADGGKGISIFADTEALQIAVGDAWSGMLDELNKSELCFVARPQLLDAVFFVDTSRINSSLIVQTEQDSPLPDRVPNTHEEESSLPSAPSHSTEAPASAASTRPKKRVIVPRSTTPAVDIQSEDGGLSAQPAPLPAPALGEEPPVRASEEPDGTGGRRRPLVRRARTNATQSPILGVDDPSFASFALSQSPEPQSAGAESAALVESQIAVKPPSSSTAPTGRSSRLKKRARADKEYNPILASLEQEIAAAAAPHAEQPPLKRFKALFDETDPDRVASQMTSGVTGSILDSQMFSQMTAENSNAVQSESGALGAPLVVIHEEEESQSLPTEGTGEREDVEMGNTNGNEVAPPSQLQPRPPSKASVPTSQIHAEPFGSTQVAKHSNSKGGAAPGKPDTDAAFLQALASTKKGKRREDDFDREFNNLRISKPERDRDAEAEAEDWRVLADFGDESNIMGNFMVIVEMDVPGKHKDSSRDTSRSQSRGPDFKKFKKKTSARQRPPVELVAEDENDYGMGRAYWKGSQSQPQSQGATQGDFSIPQQGLLQPSQSQDRGFLQPKPGPSTQITKPRSQSQAQTQSKVVKTETQEIARRGRSRPLQVVEDDDEDSEDVQPRASKMARAATNGKGKSGKSHQLFLSDEDEDEDETGGVAKTNHIEDRGDLELDLDLDDVEMSGNEPTATTLRSTAQSSAETTKSKVQASPAKRGTHAKKRTAALLDDDSDTGMAFKGFGGKKKARAK